MASLRDLGRLSSSDWERLQDCADRFEACWLKADPGAPGLPGPAITPFLPAPGDRLRLAVLYELIKIDLEVRWRRGQKAHLEQYLQQFPELGPASALDASLIYEEFRVRQRLGDKPSLSAYQLRFPDQAAELARLVQVESVQETLAATRPVSSQSRTSSPSAPYFFTKARKRVGSLSCSVRGPSAKCGGPRVPAAWRSPSRSCAARSAWKRPNASCNPWA